MTISQGLYFITGIPPLRDHINVAIQNYCYVITPNRHVFKRYVRLNMSALIVFLLIFYVFFSKKNTWTQRWNLFIQCDTMHLYIERKQN